jgi:hypothetical protein
MIKLKTEVNKSAIMRELRKEAESMYDNAYEGEYAIEQFLNGAEALFKKLRIHDVVGRSEQLISFLQWYIKDEAKRDEPNRIIDIVERYLNETN